MKKNNKKGFTLVELVIVVAVMAVLVAVAIPTVKSIVGTAEDAVADTNAKTVESMLKLEMAEKVSLNGSDAADLTADEIVAALKDAALGVAGTFYYDKDLGTVATSGTASVTDWTITLSKNADPTCVAYSGS